MTPEAQRIAIAEACGWQCVHSETFPDGNGGFTWDARGMPPKHNLRQVLPEYLEDLNAMHEAEKVMTPTEDERDSCEGIWCDYGVKLSEICGYNEHDRAWFAWEVYRATAAQRAEAFLRTLGKWEDDK